LCGKVEKLSANNCAFCEIVNHGGQPPQGIVHSKNGGRTAVRVANYFKIKWIESTERFTILARCGAYRVPPEDPLAAFYYSFWTRPIKGAYVKQKQQVSFRFAEIASWRVGGSSLQP
jgi:hypothetical protein